MNDFRLFLYPFGLIGSFLFFIRFLLQWLRSEKKGVSVNPKWFWEISLVANCLMFVHYLIQVHYTFSLVQIINAYISWRNLRLLNPEYRKKLPLKQHLLCLGALSALTTALFLAQGYFLLDEMDWVRSPTVPYFGKKAPLSLASHLLGGLSTFIFASRFWIQWWETEKHQRSHFPKIFWQLSLVGGLGNSVYSFLMGDWITFLGSVLGLLPYLRNLMLFKVQGA